MKKESGMKLIRIGGDLAQHVFQDRARTGSRSQSGARNLVVRVTPGGDGTKRAGLRNRHGSLQRRPYVVKLIVPQFVKRTVLIQDARSMIRTAKAKDDPLTQWVMQIATTRHPDIAAVALANKTARIARAKMAKETDYRPESLAA
jgi:hypothetical protein